MYHPRPSLGIHALVGILLVLTGCQGQTAATLSVVPTILPGAATLRVAIGPAPGRYRTLYVREQDWRRAEVTLSQNGATWETRSVDAVVDPATGARSVRLTFTGLQPGSGYALSLKLYRPTPDGAETLLEELSRPAFSVRAGDNEQALTLGTDGKLLVPAAPPVMVTGSRVSSWPKVGSLSGLVVEEPGTVVVAPDGSSLIADWSNHCINRVSADGSTMTLIAGTGTAGFADGPAATAQFNWPSDLALAPDGAILVADSDNNRIRRISPDGTTVTTLAGDGTYSFADGPAATAKFRYPASIRVAADGVIFVADHSNDRIRRISADGATVSTVAGDGVRGFADAASANARFNRPWGIALAADGGILVADSGNNRIRRISPDGAAVTTLAGDGTQAFADGLVATSRFAYPWGLVENADGSILVADSGNNRIRLISSDGTTVSTVAGDGTAGLVDGPAAAARFNAPWGIALAGDGRIIVADYGNAASRVIAADHSAVSTLMPGSRGFADGPAEVAKFNFPKQVALAPDGAVIVADASNNRIRRIAPDGGSVTTLAGDGTAGFADGPAATARFNWPNGLAIAADGGIFVADSSNHRIRRISPDGVTVTTVAGDGTSGFVEGPAATSRFSWPYGLGMAADGTLLVADSGNNRIRRLSPDGTTVSTLAGDGTAAFADGGSATARFSWPEGVAAAADGSVLVADTYNYRVRRVSPDGLTVTTVAGDGVAAHLDGAAATAQFRRPVNLAATADGAILVTDQDGARIRRISPDGATVTTWAGDGLGGYVDGPRATARFQAPYGLAVGTDGTVYVSVSNWIRRIAP